MSRPKLYSIAFELTAACNQKCDYCYNEWRDDGGAHVATGGRDKVLARITRMLDTFDVAEVTLTGGEPFLRPDIFELITAVRKRGVRLISPNVTHRETWLNPPQARRGGS